MCEFQCDSCDSNYIGYTSRHLHLLIKEQHIPSSVNTLRINTIKDLPIFLSSPFCVPSRVCLQLLFCLMWDITKCRCKTSQNVAFRIYLNEVNTKFHVNHHYRCKNFLLHSFWYHLMKNLHSCNTQGNCWKNNLNTEAVRNEWDRFAFHCVRLANIEDWEYGVDIIFKIFSFFCSFSPCLF